MSDLRRRSQVFKKKYKAGISPGDSSGIDISEQEWQDYADLGIKQIRISLRKEVTGADINNPDYSKMDKVIKKASSLGIEVIMNLSYESANFEFTNQDGRNFYSDPSEIMNIVAGNAIKHFSPLGVTKYEIWNEPNWAWYVSPNDYAKMMSTLYSNCASENWGGDNEISFIAFSLDANAYDYSNGINPGSMQYISDVYRSEYYIEFKKEFGHSPWDIVAVHPYHTVEASSNGTVIKNKVKNCIDSVILIMSTYGDAKMPIYVTEWGVNTVDDLVQGNTIKLMMEEISKINNVKSFMYFKYSYGGTNYGIVKNGIKRASFEVFKNAIADIPLD